MHMAFLGAHSHAAALCWAPLEVGARHRLKGGLANSVPIIFTTILSNADAALLPANQITKPSRFCHNQSRNAILASSVQRGCNAHPYF